MEGGTCCFNKVVLVAPHTFQSLALAKYFEKEYVSLTTQPFAHKRVLELGSGTGVVGIVACLWGSSPCLSVDLLLYSCIVLL